MPIAMAEAVDTTNQKTSMNQIKFKYLDGRQKTGFAHNAEMISNNTQNNSLISINFSI